MEGSAQSPGTGGQNPQPVTPSYPDIKADTHVGGMTPEKPRHPMGRKFILFIFFIIFAVLIFGLSALTMFAYEVIPLPNKDLQKTISKIVIGLPFMPKTTEYVLESSVEAHKDVTRFTVDASLATSAKTLGSLIGGNFDLKITGPVDYTDPNNPSADLDVTITKDFNMDLIIKDKISYMRINKIPSSISLLLAGFGYDESFTNQLLNKWYFSDATTLDTDARKMLEENNSGSNPTNESIDQLFSILEEEELKESITMTSTSLDSIPVYQISFTPNDNALDIFWQKLMEIYEKETSDKLAKDFKITDYLKGFKFDTWIDKENFYVRKSAASFTIKLEQNVNEQNLISSGVLPLQVEDIPVTFVTSFSNFGEAVNVIAPEGATDINELFFGLMTGSATQSGDFVDRISDSNNAKRDNDVTAIHTALFQYAADNQGAFPSSITLEVKPIAKNGVDLCSLIVPDYIIVLPVDPSINSGNPVTNCNGQYDTGYTIQKDNLDRITISAPLAEDEEEISATR